VACNLASIFIFDRPTSASWVVVFFIVASVVALVGIDLALERSAMGTFRSPAHPSALVYALLARPPCNYGLPEGGALFLAQIWHDRALRPGSSSEPVFALNLGVPWV
jgi:hypothetical protein